MRWQERLAGSTPAFCCPSVMTIKPETGSLCSSTEDLARWPGPAAFPRLGEREGRPISELSSWLVRPGFFAPRGEAGSLLKVVSRSRSWSKRTNATSCVRRRSCRKVVSGQSGLYLLQRGWVRPGRATNRHRAGPCSGCCRPSPRARVGHLFTLVAPLRLHVRDTQTPAAPTIEVT